MSCSCNEWSAVAQPSDGRRLLKVEGHCECPRDGYKLRLEPTNEGIIDNPKLIALALEIEAPAAGPAVMTREPVKWETTINDQVEIVEIRIPEGEDRRLTITSD